MCCSDSKRLLEEAVLKLHDLLDEIDTLSDMVNPAAIEDYKNFYRTTKRLCDSRHTVIVLDSENKLHPAPKPTKDDSHIVVTCYDGNLHVLPVKLIQDIIIGSRKIEEVEEYAEIIKKVFFEWLSNLKK